MFFISQDRMKAIEASAIKFFVIPKDRNGRGNFNLLAKSPDVDSGNFYDYLILFEHKDLNVVMHVMNFLSNGTIIIDSKDKKNILVIDLPDLYRHGMKKIGTNGQDEKRDDND